MNTIKLVGVYENNLKDISLKIYKNKITCITGVSGSGKSTLIYDVISKEAERKEKIDKGNATCLDFAIRPKFKKIENLPYAITLKQRNIGQSISSTIATYTGLYDLLRLEFSESGKIIGKSNKIIEKPSPLSIIEYIKRFLKNKHLKIYAVVLYKKFTDGKKELSLLRKHNIKKAIFISSSDNKEKFKDIPTSLNPKFYHTILVPIERIEDILNYENIAKEGFWVKGDNIDLYFEYDYPDLEDGTIYQKPTPELFSFNSTHVLSGKCEKCNGKGVVDYIDWKTLINEKKPLSENFLNIEKNSNGCYKFIRLCDKGWIKSLKEWGINPSKTFNDLNEDQKKLIKEFLYPLIVKHKLRPIIQKYIYTDLCDLCKGTRLNYKANAVKLYNKSISELMDLTVEELFNFLKDKPLKHKKILDILIALKNATLEYLSLNRTTDTLSGGELQRLKFAVEFIGNYKNLLYIFDEPSSGLHPYNNNKIFQFIKGLQKKGNTILISEHNPFYIKNSDYVIELGPGSGKHGGYIVYNDISKNYKLDSINIKRNKITSFKKELVLIGVKENNINNENLNIPLNCLVSVIGISGSGKSTLIHKVLVPNIKFYLANKGFLDNVKEIQNISFIKDVIELTQNQIGNNPRSIVATYLGIFDYIREIYASTDLAKELGFTPSHFSFNSEEGACETCKGNGFIDDNICPDCLGKRYKPEILEITFKGKNIYELLNTEINELKELFQDNEKLYESIKLLKKVGLEYLNLGRITPSLSGGEAQRIRLVKVLLESYKKINEGGYLFIFDEPTSGLNQKNLHSIIKIFNELIEKNNSVIIIEHNLEIIKNSDYIIELGPGSGKHGGKVVFKGTFDELIKTDTLTSKALRGIYDDIEPFTPNLSNLIEKKFNFDINLYSCHPFYKKEEHFLIEREFAKNYIIKNKDEDNIFYFKHNHSMIDELKKIISSEFKILFNPYVVELYKYKKVPKSIKKEILARLKKIDLIQGNINNYLEIDEWKTFLPSKNIEQAFNLGRGWIILENKGKFIHYTNRVLSLSNFIIGTPSITEYTFNLYTNSCLYCKGKQYLETYDEEELIKDKNKSIVDKDFFSIPIKLKVKSILEKFKKENLFDLLKPYKELSKEERNILFFGFKEYKFLKPKGNKKSLKDWIIWKGINFYINDFLNSHPEYKLKTYVIKCPFCNGTGFKREIEFYYLNNKTIMDYIKEGL
jgi:excinuclease ABC subunit A